MRKNWVIHPQPFETLARDGAELGGKNPGIDRIIGKLALQLRNLQTLIDISVDKNSTIVFPSPLMSTIEELGSFLAREQSAADEGLSPERS